MAYNLTRESQSILKQYETSSPSFSVQLYHDNWTLNSGPKFLYNSPTFSALFDDIKAHRIPIDLLELFDAAKVPFYEGCMIVEIEEFKPPDAKDSKIPEKTVARVLLRPNSETLFADLCLLNQKSGGKWTDKDALEVEAKILLATSPPLCLDPDPRLGKIANSLYRVSLPRTPPPLRPKKRKANGLESTEEDEASVNRKTKIIRFMDPKPTRSATPSYRLLDHITRTKAAAPPQSTENNPPAVPAVNYSNPLHSIPVNHAPTQQPTPQPQPQAHTQTPSHPQPQPQPQPQSQPQSQPQPQQPQPPPPLQPQPQPQPQLQPTQPQQPPRSIPTPVVAAPSTPGSADTKKSTPKPAAKRTQTPGDGTLGTPTPSATPVQATPQLAPQHLRATNHPTSRPTSQSPHPTAVVNGSASTMGSSPRVAPSPALHAMAVAATNASSSSPRPPAQSAIQPQQGQPQPQPQPQAVPQARAPFPQQAKGFGPPPQTYMNVGAAGMTPALYKHLVAQAQSQNAKAGMMGQSTQQMYYMMQAQVAQAQAQAQAQAHVQGQGQVQGVNLNTAQLQAQARYAAQVAQMQAAQAQQQQQQQQQNVPAPHLSRTPMSNSAIVGATANPQATSSPMPNANGQGQHVASQHFAASGQGQQSPQQSHQQQQFMASAQAKAQYAANLQQQQQQQQRQQGHPGQTQDAAPTQQMYIPMNMNPQMLQQLQLVQQQAAQAQAGGRVGGYPMHMWQQLQTSMGMNGIPFRQGGGQPHPNLTAAQAAQVKAQQQGHAQSQGAGAR